MFCIFRYFLEDPEITHAPAAILRSFKKLIMGPILSASVVALNIPGKCRENAKMKIITPSKNAARLTIFPEIIANAPAIKQSPVI